MDIISPKALEYVIEYYATHCECGTETGCIHLSDCALHNEPAYPATRCNCVEIMAKSPAFNPVDIAYYKPVVSNKCFRKHLE